MLGLLVVHLVIFVFLLLSMLLVYPTHVGIDSICSRFLLRATIRGSRFQWGCFHFEACQNNEKTLSSTLTWIIGWCVTDHKCIKSWDMYHLTWNHVNYGSFTIDHCVPSELLLLNKCIGKLLVKPVRGLRIRSYDHPSAPQNLEGILHVEMISSPEYIFTIVQKWLFYASSHHELARLGMSNDASARVEIGR